MARPQTNPLPSDVERSTSDVRRSPSSFILLFSLLLAAATASLALAQDRSSSYDRSDRSRHSDRSDRESRHSSRSSRSSRNGSYASSYASAASPTSQPTSFLDGYRLVLDRNIFSRNRVIYREASSASPTTAPAYSYRSLPALTFTGVSKETGVATALVEDRRTNQTNLLHVGDPIADGRVTAINLDSLDYVNAAGKTVRVDIGQPFENGPTYSVSSSPSASSFGGPSYTPSPAVGTSASPAAPGDANDIIERLRQKRLQETKR